MSEDTFWGVDLLIRNARIMRDDPFENSVRVDVGIVGDKIAFVDSLHDHETKPGRVLDARDRFLLPGLVNAHTHSYGNLFKGMTDRLPLEVWMLFALAARGMTPEEAHASALLGCVDLTRSGVTTVLDQITLPLEGLDRVGQAYLQAGLRAFLSPMVSDRPYQATLPISEGDLPGELLEDFNRGANTTEQALGLCREVATLWKRGELRGFSGVHLGPSGPQRCSDALLVCLHQMAVEMDLGVHTHLLETRIQRDTAHAFYGQNMLLHLEDLGILSDRWSFAHGVWLAEPEALRLGGKRGVTVVHNPVSNLFLASGIAPVKRLIEAGINVALGTDGANCAGNQSMFEAMKMAACLGKVRERDPDMWLTGTEVFTMATRTGAGMLGVPAGDIEAGQKADLVLMEERPWCVPESHIVNQVVYSAGAGDVSAVVAGGRVLMEEGTLLTIDEKETYAMALEALRSVLSRNKEAFRQAERYSGELMRVYRRLAHLGERR